jgi:hypothetical protein
MSKRSRTLLFALLAAVALFVCCADAALAGVKITAIRPARVFFPGEKPWLNLSVTDYSGSFTWRITDAYGREVLDRRMWTTPQDPVILSVPYLLPYGIYYVSLDFGGGNVVADAFCVIPRPDDDPGDYRQFGLQWQGTDDQTLGSFALAGARYDRVDVAWLNGEPAPQTLDTSQADGYAAPAQKYGLQLIPIFGYTPVFNHLRPADATDRVAAAPHCWEPKDTEEWAWWVNAMGQYLGSKTVSWPPLIAGAPLAGAAVTLPLVNRWEIWNEVDQSFYYGTWEKYLELLRIAYMTLHGQDASALVLYGGACAHWTELGITCGANQHYYFDEMAWHGNGIPEQNLVAYMFGVPSLVGYRYALPKETAHTEAYFTAPTGIPEAAYLMRLYAGLKALRQGLYCRSGCIGGVVGSADPGSQALVWQNGDQAIPNATYVAFAAARYWLSDAAYAGPLKLAANAYAHLFLKHGRPFLVAWSDPGATVSIKLGAGACSMDFTGNLSMIGGSGPRSFRLTGSPTVLLGVDDAYVAEAAGNYCEQALTTAFGVVPDQVNGYAGQLQIDAGGVSPDVVPRIRAAMAKFQTASATDWKRQTDLLDAARDEVTQGIATYVSVVKPDKALTHDSPGVLYRMAKLAEWLGEVADGRAQCGAKRQVAAADREALRARIASLRGTVGPADGSILHPFAGMMLQRAGTQLALSDVWGTGTLAVAKAWADEAQSIASFEPAVVTGIFPTVAFDTADRLTKATLIAPGTTQTLDLHVYNFTGGKVSGKMTVEFPGTWSPQSVQVSFAVNGNTHTAAIPVQVSLPGTPTPWVTAVSETTADSVSLSDPPGLAADSELWVRTTLDDGRALLPVRYRVSVGKYPAK